MRELFTGILCFSVCISFAQNLKILDAQLRTHITREEPNRQQVAGFVDLTAEIENQTNDTLYLMARAVEPFIDDNPFQFHQVQNSVGKFSENCGGYFIYPYPPRGNSFYPFDKKRDILKIAPKSSVFIERTIDIEEGFCPKKGEKIEVSMTYKLIWNDFSWEQEQKSISDKNVEIAVLEDKRKAAEKDIYLSEKTTLIGQLNEKIESLNRQIEFASERIEEFNQLQKIPFYMVEIKSNSVFVNE